VQALFSRIEKDRRHDRIRVLESERVGGRVFSRWAMAKVAEDGDPDIPLIAAPGRDRSGRRAGHHPEQESLLDIMREATRSDARAI
jgi:hypothetical protein